MKKSYVRFLGIQDPGAGLCAMFYDDLATGRSSTFALDEKSLLARIQNIAKYGIDDAEEQRALVALRNARSFK